MTESTNATPRFAQTSFETHFSDQANLMFSTVQPAQLLEPKMLAVSEYRNEFPELQKVDFFQATQAQFWSGDPAHTPAPIALVYSGHQFGVWAGQLGDGRAMTLGKTPDQHRQTQEIQLKGAGPTPYSRFADGRAVLRSSIREFLCSEAMHALGVPTTRVLTLTGAKTAVIRENVEEAAVVSRVAPSFLRFGSFEHYFHNQMLEQLKALCDFLLKHHFPELQDSRNPAASLLSEITKRSAQLVAQWQAVGFCHGVLNTDNMSVLGLTLDYGPFGFMEAFDAGYICNHSDYKGRYAWQNQPGIVQWNCFALGQTFVPLIGSTDETKSVLDVFKPTYDMAMRAQWQLKLGLTEPLADDANLIDAMFLLMQANHCDWTLWFRTLAQFNENDPSQEFLLLDLCIDRAQCQSWLDQYRTRLKLQGLPFIERQAAMNQINPKYVLRNYLAQQAIERAEKGDMSEFHRLHQVLSRPFDEQPENSVYAALPPDWAKTLEVSCSS